MPNVFDEISGQGAVALSHVREAKQGADDAASGLEKSVALHSRMFRQRYERKVAPTISKLYAVRTLVFEEVEWTLAGGLGLVENHRKVPDVPTGLARLAPVLEGWEKNFQPLEQAKQTLSSVHHSHRDVAGWPPGHTYQTDIFHLIKLTESVHNTLEKRVVVNLRTLVNTLQRRVGGGAP